MQKKYVYHFTFLYNPRDFPTLLPPTFLSIINGLPYASSFNCNVYNKVHNCYSLEHFPNLVRFCFVAIVMSLSYINLKKKFL